MDACDVVTTEFEGARDEWNLQHPAEAEEKEA